MTGSRKKTDLSYGHPALLNSAYPALSMSHPISVYAIPSMILLKQH